MRVGWLSLPFLGLITVTVVGCSSSASPVLVDATADPSSALIDDKADARALALRAVPPSQTPHSASPRKLVITSWRQYLDTFDGRLPPQDVDFSHEWILYYGIGEEAEAGERVELTSAQLRPVRDSSVRVIEIFGSVTRYVGACFEGQEPPVMDYAAVVEAPPRTIAFRYLVDARDGACDEPPPYDCRKLLCAPDELCLDAFGCVATRPRGE